MSTSTSENSALRSVAIIPARGGSKRIPGKNIRELAGKPMIAWSIEAALECPVIDRVIVSTDDDRIAEIAQEYGAEAPFRRPEELANDYATCFPVMQHAIDEVSKRYGTPEYVCCLYATAPFVTAQSLEEGFGMLTDRPETEFVFTAGEHRAPIFRALQLHEDGTTEMFWPEHALTRSQDLPRAFFDAGQFYWGTYEGYMKHDSFFHRKSRMLLLPDERVQDIDTPDDWARAERMMNLLLAQT